MCSIKMSIDSTQVRKSFKPIVYFRRSFWLLCIWLSLGVAASGQHLPDEITDLSDEYIADRWTIEEGLPVNSVQQVVQTSDGYLWIVTYAGIARFDGISFTTFNTETHPELPTNRFHSMVETPDSTYWFTTIPRVFISFKENRFKVWNKENGLAGDQVLDMNLDEKGTLWIATESGVSTYKNGNMEAFRPEKITGRVDRIFPISGSGLVLRHNEDLALFSDDSLTVILDDPLPHWTFREPFLELENGTLLLGTSKGLYAYDDHPGFHKPRPDSKLRLVHSLSAENDRINAIHETAAGEVLFNVHKEGFYRWTGNGSPTLYQPHTDITETFIRSADYSYTASGNDTWKITDRQLFKNETQILQHSDLLSDYIFDREGSIWIGTYSSGLIRLKPSVFQTYSTPEGLSDPNVYSVLETETGEILAGSMHGGLQIIHPDGSVSTVASETPIKGLHELHNGTVLVGKGEKHLHEWSRQDGIQPWRADSVHVPELVNAILEYPENHVWVGSGTGLYLHLSASDESLESSKRRWFREQISDMFDEGWNNLTKDLNLPEAPVHYFATAPDSTLWMATAGNGMYGLQFTQKKNSDSSVSAADNIKVLQPDIPADFIRSIYVDISAVSQSPAEDQNTTGGYYLWVGTEGRGLFRVQWNSGNQEISNLTRIQSKDGLPNNTIHQILNDERGNFWMSTNRGILKAGIENLHAWSDGEQEALHITTYTEANGLNNREANGNVQPAGIRASDGSLWFPTQGGLAKIHHQSIRSNTTPPPVKIERVETDDSLWTFPDQLNLNANQRNFEIKYAGLSYLAPENVLFSYKLEGFDENWIEAGTRRTAYYTNVPPGSYRFKVRAFNNDRVESAEAATAIISVAPYFYETLWFMLAMVFLGISFVLGAVWLWIKKMKKDERILRETVDRRTSELKEAMAQLEDQAQQLTKLDKAKSRFFANMSHEFRTPLTLILGPIEELVRKKKYPAIHHKLSLMRRNGYRLKRLVDQVLELVKLETDNLELSLQAFDMEKFVMDIADMFRASAKKQGLELKVTTNTTNRSTNENGAGAENDFMVVADRNKTEHILANLLSNAIKFTEEGGSIEVSLNDTPEQIEISVSDTGKGISEEDQQNIFERFFQADDGDDRPEEGLGIGLALCKELMDLHKGDISVESKPGIGTTFRLVFLKGLNHFRDTPSDIDHFVPERKNRKPVMEASSVDDEPSDRKNVAYSHDHATILLIEDHDDMRQYLKSTLEDTYKILEAMNGEEALEIIRKTPPDLIIADIMMPVMDGLTFNRRLRKTPLHKNIPLLFLTALADDSDQIQALNQGGNDYLTKPFNPNVLKARVSALLSSQQRLRRQILMKESAENGSVQSENWQAMLTQHISKNFSDPNFGVDELADKMNVSRSQLHRKTKQYTDRTPVQLIKEARLRKARQLIKSGKTNYSEIAYACGFNSLSYFSRSYKNFFKHSPSATNPESIS